MEDGNPQLISPPPQNDSSPFLYKAIFFSIFLLFVPLFSSSTASWGELLQLVFVGIAVSYGLFSTKRNIPPHDETHKQETLSDAQSYVARLFQPSSSLFDDHDEDTSNTKVWNSQYYRGEPIVVVANKESSVIDDHKNTPVVVSSKLDRFNSTPNPEEEKEENSSGVLRSPVPWRSTSGRNMAASPSNPVVPPPPPPPSVRSKSFQDFGSSRKKMTSPPIPPPPPPLPLNRNYDLQNSSSSSRGTRGGSSLSSSFREPNQTQQQQDEEDLSHDHEIESFIETRGGGKFIINEHRFIPNPKQQQQDEKKKEITDTEESSSEDDDELASKTSNGNREEIVGPDVDKKADEFIAKFREQIRLQRIASIRTSTQIHKKNI